MVFFPSKHVFVKFLDNYNLPWAADGTNRYLIEARIDQYTTLSNNMRLCISNDSLSFLKYGIFS